MSATTTTPDSPTVPSKSPGFLTKAFTAKGPGEENSGGWFTRIVLLLVVGVWLLPTIGLLVTSLRTPAAANDSGWWTVLTEGGLQISNYSEVLSATSGGSTLAEAFVNSIVVAVPATVIPILIAAFAAYAFSWMEFKGREPLFILFVALLVVPLQVAFIPIIQLQVQIDSFLSGTLGFDNFTLNGSFLAIWLAHAGFGMPLAVYLLRNYIGALPKEVIESAKVDGAGHFQTFWRLIIPLSVPALAAFAIFQFLWTWNDFLVALIMLNSAAEGQVATTYLAGLQGTFGEQLHLLTAGAFITMTIPLAVFFGLQRFFVRGLTAGSVKG
ncbi:Alpha-glucoside transport system permease protein AglG [Euzebya pacifica]|uniref:Alpha-glucoside transport system permease protein AglG n=1 Tax=Euzebya pacifica TaxID=1608957 RepID=A0A346XYW3_9ACTN|nr:carbohydrate ABC transporter permease [Euzebya pacifica]AXV07410.1 Alpha-glucoside transport system permease protein AglG [Euzebya pacifica]